LRGRWIGAGRKGRQAEEKRNEKERIGRRRDSRDAEEGEFNVTRRMDRRKIMRSRDPHVMGRIQEPVVC
jgi:hypothetical protein